MTTKLTTGQSLAWSASSAQEGTAASAEGQTAATEAPPRLEIVADPHNGFVYTLTDRETGQVIARLPRESVRPQSAGCDPASP